MGHLFGEELRRGRSEYFKFESDEYKPANYVMASNAALAINSLGLCMTYYIRTYDPKYDPIWGEDNNSRFIRKFETMARLHTPDENKFFSKFGIEQNDDITLFISKLHFREASQDPITREEYIPKLADIIEVNFSKMLYEITSIPKITDFTYFQSPSMFWEVVVRPYKDEKITVDDGIIDTSLSMTSNLDFDIFQVNNTVEVKKEDVVFVPTKTEQSKQIPYESW